MERKEQILTSRNEPQIETEKVKKSRKISIKLILFIFAVLFVLCICSLIALFTVSVLRQVGSGNVVSENRSTDTFTEIRLEGEKMNLFVEQGTTQSLKIEAEDNVINKIDTRVKGETLTVSYKKSIPFDLVPLSFLHKEVNVYVTVKDLDAVYVVGSGNIETKNELVLDSFKLDIIGSSNVDMDIRLFELETNVSGSAKINYKGSVNTQALLVSGSCDYFAKDLESEYTNIELSGSGNIELNVQLKLDVDISGSGTIKYRGSPKVTQEISGSGTVEEL